MITLIPGIKKEEVVREDKRWHQPKQRVVRTPVTSGVPGGWCGDQCCLTSWWQQGQWERVPSAGLPVRPSVWCGRHARGKGFVGGKMRSET